jgi:Bacterial regulatory proteins, luxR family
MAQGRTNTAIARSLVVTEAAVHKHIGAIFAKLVLPSAATTTGESGRCWPTCSAAGEAGSMSSPRRGHPHHPAPGEPVTLISTLAGSVL